MTIRTNILHNADCLEQMKTMPDNCIDLICTDPPYQLSATSRPRPDQTKEGSYGKEVPFSRQQSRIKGFMGKEWDVLPPVETWQEALRVLKPGGFAFIMCTPRQDSLSQMICNLHEAGFETGFTSMYWAYASGFPKAQDISKAVDKKGGKYLGWFIDYVLEIAKQRNIPKKELQLLFPSKNNKPTGWLWNKRFTQSITIEQFNKIKDFFNLPFDNIEEAEREIIGKKKTGIGSGKNYAFTEDNTDAPKEVNITEPTTPQAKALSGSYAGFQPKPAVEVIIVAMKSLNEKTYCNQALANRKGITWLDDCQIPYQSEQDRNSMGWKDSVPEGMKFGGNSMLESSTQNKKYDNTKDGRFPANLLCSYDALNDGTIHTSGEMDCIAKNDPDKSVCYGKYNPHPAKNPKSEGSFSRFFNIDAWWNQYVQNLPERVRKTFPFLIVPKAAKSEKNKGLEKGKEKHNFIVPNNPICLKCSLSKYERRKCEGNCKCKNPVWKESQDIPNKNFHPTTKPVKLMSYLIVLGSREGDVVLDPFAGSGTTCIAAEVARRKWIGIEKDKEYYNIAQHRIKEELRQAKLF